MTAALCATLIRTEGDLWFSTDPTDREAAKRICRRCPLHDACQQAGLNLGPYARGVWGGLSSGDRRVLRTGIVAADPDDDSDDAPARRTEPPACGTEGAYTAHRHRGEHCPTCQTAHEDRVTQGRRDRLETEHAKGGTHAGYRLHWQLREAACRPCREAASRKRAEDAARARLEGRAAWARREGSSAAPEAVQGPSGAAA